MSHKNATDRDVCRQLHCRVPIYAELRPDELDALWTEGRFAVIPWGALEWHGSHLPLGLDGIVAEWFAARLAVSEGAVLLPGIWLPMTTLPHQHSLQIRTETFRMLLDDLFAGLYQSGARKVCLVTGHYAHGHLIEMTEAAIRAMEDHEGLLVFVGTPLELLDDEKLLDHAAHYETSQLLAIRPDLVRLAELPDDAKSTDTAVLGDSPALGSADEGIILLNRGLAAWRDWIQSGTFESVTQHYRLLFDRYEPYVDAYYKGSWEDAIKEWWKDQDNTP